MKANHFTQTNYLCSPIRSHNHRILIRLTRKCQLHLQFIHPFIFCCPSVSGALFQSKIAHITLYTVTSAGSSRGEFPSRVRSVFLVRPRYAPSWTYMWNTSAGWHPARATSYWIPQPKCAPVHLSSPQPVYTSSKGNSF